MSEIRTKSKKTKEYKNYKQALNDYLDYKDIIDTNNMTEEQRVKLQELKGKNRKLLDYIPIQN